ncbi:glycosyltransferase family 2 protein [Amniculibacterium aquaticum]|uniref:glycosyltransferase family 2 protein n=1 Tax=Amniculibacterium aquaticum TaxID=2479858 RepID=UPI000F5A72DD|nr:glycosyltransferase family 2 protein [Amniculibacterium aquaticum]
MSKIYFIISAYNEESNVEILVKQLDTELQKVNLENYELVFVNDGSTDATLPNLVALQKEFKNIVIINQSKNFGHEMAMTAGLNFVASEKHAGKYAVLFMDADLQHPVELAIEMIGLWQNGNQLVLTKRVNNEDTGLRYKIMGNTYYWLLNMISEVKIPRNMPDFRLLDKKYVEWLNQLNENDRMFRGMLSLVGLRDAKVIDFVAPKRLSGTSKYNFWKLYKLAIDSVIQFSVKPLRVATVIGLLGCILSVLFLGYSIYSSLTSHEPKTGFLTLLTVMTFFCSLIILFLGIIGEYIGRIHIEVKQRPLYFNEIIRYEEQ